MSTGFGYIPSTNEYTVVVVYYNYADPFPPGKKISVYTLGSGKWRDKGETSYEELDGGNQGLRLNGAVYWVNQYSSEIVSFDLETEEFRIVPSPTLPPDMYYANVGSLGGCLYVIRKHIYNSADVLVRNQKDLHTWSWKFSITYKELGPDCKPLAILSSGKILWHSAHHKPCLVYYDPETGSLEMDENLIQFKSWTGIIHYEKSFVSQKALGEMNARIYDLDDYIT